MNKIIIEHCVWEKMYQHVLSDNNEHFAFFLVNHYQNQNDITFLVKDVICIDDSELEPDGFGLKLKLDGLLKVINRTKKENKGLIEIHSHPFSTTNVRFSRTDNDGFAEFVPYILDDLEGKPYAAMVLGQCSVDAICWQNKVGKTVDKIVIHGKNLRIIFPSSIKKTAQMDKKRYDRQILAFGVDAQKTLAGLDVGIVGLGGMGSEILQKLVYLGVRSLVLIDDDKISEDSLNRLIGAFASDLGQTKVTIATRHAKNICGEENVRIVPKEKDVLNEDVIKELVGVDFIFGCVDNDGARTLLNEIAKAFLIPYLDCAVGIILEEEKIVQIGGRAILVLPKKPCLQCLYEIDVDEATHFLQTEREQQFNEKQGYVSGVNVPSPSVVHLNGIVANAGLMEFFSYVTGFRPANVYSIYDAQKQKLVVRDVHLDPKCFVCNWIEGNGDKADIINRFAKRTFDQKTGVEN